MSRIMIRIELVTHVDAGDVFNDLQKTEKGQKKKLFIYLFRLHVGSMVEV